MPTRIQKKHLLIILYNINYIYYIMAFVGLLMYFYAQ